MMSEIDWEGEITVIDMFQLDLFDDVPFKFLKYNALLYDESNDDCYIVSVQDVVFDMEGWNKTRFTFELREPPEPHKLTEMQAAGEDISQLAHIWKEFVVEKVYRKYSTYQDMLYNIIGWNDEDEDEEEEEEETLTMNKIMEVILFNNDIYERTPWASHIKHKICGNKEMAKQVKIIADLSLQACNNKDIELWNRMDKKRKEIVYKIMDNLEDVKNDISDNEYLKVCNYVKSIY
jgi:hypothetical protein